ncbi:MAG: nicotinic acid mononucleotide adenylyltransferase, partial [Deltaproteobacteria bacterium]
MFGGTFDPLHNGHLRMAIEVKEALRLPRVVLLPA